MLRVGDASSVPHLIHVLRVFGDAELPLAPGVGVLCTQSHCVDALEHITGAKVGISYSSWKRWWDTTHPGQLLGGPPNSALSPSHSAVTPHAYCSMRRAVGRVRYRRRYVEISR